MRENEPDSPESCPKAPDSGTRWRSLALVVVLPVVPVVASLPLTAAQKIGLFSGLVIVAEVVFWVAALFDPREWFRKG